MRPFIRQILAVVVLLVSGMSALRGADASPQSAEELMQRVGGLLQKATDAPAGREADGLVRHAFDSLCDCYPIFEMEYGTSAKKMDAWPVALKQATLLYDRVQKAPSAAAFPFGADTTLNRAYEAWMLVFNGNYDQAIQLAKQYQPSSKSPSYIKERERQFMVSALVFAYVEKGDCASAADAVESELKEWSASLRLHAMAAYMFARAGRLDEARAQCQLVYDLSPKSYELRITEKISKQYNFNIQPPTVDDLMSKYINTEVPRMREAGIVALGAHKIPGAYDALAAYFNDSSTTEGEKRAALIGMTWLTDERSAAFLVDVALSGKGDYSREAFNGLCFAKNEKAVLEVINRGQETKSVLDMLNYMDFGLRRVFNDGPAQDDQSSVALSSWRWVKWLRQTGRIQRPTAQPSLPIAEADARRTEDFWFFMKRGAVFKNIAVFDDIIKLCDEKVKDIEAKKEGASTTFTGAWKFDEYLAGAEYVAALRLEASLSFSAEDRTACGEALKAVPEICDELRVCAELMKEMMMKKYDGVVMLEKLSDLREKAMHGNSRLRAAFSGIRDNLATETVMKDQREVARALSVGRLLSNMKKMNEAVTRVRDTFLRSSDSKSKSAGDVYAEARALLVSQEADAVSINSDEVRSEYLGYYKAAAKLLNDIESYSKNGPPSSFEDEYIKLSEQNNDLGVRSMCLAKLALNLARKKYAADIIPVNLCRYENYSAFMTGSALINKSFSQSVKYMDRGMSLKRNIDELLTEADKWVSAGDSKGKYDNWRMYAPALDASLLEVAGAMLPYMTAESRKAFDAAAASWEAERVLMKINLAQLHTILDAESYKDDDGAAYRKVVGDLRAAATRGGEISQASLLKSLKWFVPTLTVPADQRYRWEALEPMIEATAALYYLGGGSDYEVKLTFDMLDWRNEELKEKMVDWRIECWELGLAGLRRAAALSDAQDTHGWMPAWLECRALWRKVLDDTIIQTEKLQTVTKERRIMVYFGGYRWNIDNLKLLPQSFIQLIDMPLIVDWEAEEL